MQYVTPTKKQNLETSKIEEKLKNINSEIEKVNKEYKPLFDSSEAKKQLEATKQQVELMQNLNVNQEDIKEWTKSLEESKGSIFKLEKERKELVEKLMPLEKQLAEEKKRQVPDVKSIKILEDAIKLNKDVTLATDKKITEEKEKQAKKSTQEADTIIKNLQATGLEIDNYIKNNTANFKSLKAGTNIILDNTTNVNEIVINATGGGGGVS